MDLTDTMPGVGEHPEAAGAGFAPLDGPPQAASFAPLTQDAPPFDAGPYAAPEVTPDPLAETTAMEAVPEPPATAEMPAVPRPRPGRGDARRARGRRPARTAPPAAHHGVRRQRREAARTSSRRRKPADGSDD